MHIKPVKIPSIYDAQLGNKIIENTSADLNYSKPHPRSDP